MADNTNARNRLSDKLVGYDLFWEDPFTGDALMVDRADVMLKDGDFVVETGPELIQRSLLRRIMTPQGAYALLVQDVDGIQLLNAEYGNPAGHLLSEPVNSTWISQVTSALAETVRQDPRVTLLDVQVNVAGAGKVTFSISYRIDEGLEAEADTQTLMVGISKDGTQFTGV